MFRTVGAALATNLALCAFVLLQAGAQRREAPPEVPLQEKLANQWWLYSRARRTLMDRAGAGQQMPRREWEALLQPVGIFQWTERDLVRLRQSQRTRIEAQAKVARRLSRIDLDMVRRSGRVREFCRLLPKGGMLHVHPTGTLQSHTVARLLNRANPVVAASMLPSGHAFRRDELAFLHPYPASTRYAELAPPDQERFRRLFLLPESTTDFGRFEAVFALIGMLEIRPGTEAFRIVCNDFCTRARQEGVRYVEFTMKVNPDEAELGELERLAREVQLRYGIALRVNAAYNRAAPAQRNLFDFRQLARMLERRPESVVVGIDLLGREADHPAFEAGQLLYGNVQRLHSSRVRLHRTMHAAGVGDPRNLRDALLLGAERVGHGTRWRDAPVALEFAAWQRLPVEANLVSSVRLGYAEGFSNHSFLDLLRLGLRVSLSTDDEGILQTDLTNEFTMAVSHTDVTYHELKQLVYHSIETAFVEESCKRRLRQQLDAGFVRFESAWTARHPARRPRVDPRSSPPNSYRSRANPQTQQRSGARLGENLTVAPGRPSTRG